MAEITSLMKDIKGILDNKNQTKSIFSLIYKKLKTPYLIIKMIIFGVFLF